jgi:uncharacterized iron-regulated membrane protein
LATKLVCRAVLGGLKAWWPAVENSDVSLLRPSELVASVEDGEGLRLGMRVLGAALAVALALMILVGVVMWGTRGEAGEIGNELDRQRLGQYQHTDVME